MISRPDIEAIWTSAESTAPEAITGGIVAREIEGEWPACGPVLGGIDPAGERHLLVGLPFGSRVRADRRSAGVHLTRRDLEWAGHVAPYLDVHCLKSHLHDLFTTIASEMVEALGASSAPAQTTCRRVMDRWRDLIDREPKRKLNLNVLTGVIGELLVLRQLARFDPNSVDSWVGPEGAVQDFQGREYALEVKTTRGRGRVEPEIHGVYQLDGGTRPGIYLAMERIERVLPGSRKGETLAQIVNSFDALETPTRTVLDQLSRLGFANVDDPMLSDVAFEQLESRLYEVGESFPRITNNSFIGGQAPPGVISVNYRLSLDSASPEPLTPERRRAAYAALAADFSGV